MRAARTKRRYKSNDREINHPLCNAELHRRNHEIRRALPQRASHSEARGIGCDRQMRAVRRRLQWIDVAAQVQEVRYRSRTREADGLVRASLVPSVHGEGVRAGAQSRKSLRAMQNHDISVLLLTCPARHSDCQAVSPGSSARADPSARRAARFPTAKHRVASSATTGSSTAKRAIGTCAQCTLIRSARTPTFVRRICRNQVAARRNLRASCFNHESCRPFHMAPRAGRTL